MIKYDFYFRLDRELVNNKKQILDYELRTLSALCFGHVPEMRIFNKDCSDLSLIVARHEGIVVGFSFSNTGGEKSEITTCVHPAYSYENLDQRLPANLKFNKNWRLLWSRSKILASLLPSRLLT